MYYCGKFITDHINSNCRIPNSLPEGSTIGHVYDSQVEINSTKLMLVIVGDSTN